MADAASSGSSSSKSLMWMTAALFAGMAVLLVGGLFLATRVVRSLGIRNSLGSGSVQTQRGTYRLEREREVGPPVPMYPHAALVVPGDDAAEQSVKDGESGITRVIYQSEDSRDFIDKWYQDRLPQGFERHDSEAPRTKEMLIAGVPDKAIAYDAIKGAHTRILALTENLGGTQISIIRMDKPDAADANGSPTTAPDMQGQTPDQTPTETPQSAPQQ